MSVEIIQQYGYNFLWIDEYLWMWDIPSEVEIEKDMAEQCYGNVLVAGYGLGVCQKFLLENSKVNKVVTIEINMQVIDACKEKFGVLHGQVICMDFYDFLPSYNTLSHIMEYDCVVGDVWEEIHPKFVSDYQRFKKHAMRFLKSDGKLISWGMDYYEYLIGKEHKV